MTLIRSLEFWRIRAEQDEEFEKSLAKSCYYKACSNSVYYVVG